MISHAEALEIIFNNCVPIKRTEFVDLRNCAGRVIAEDIYSGDTAMPPFNKSAVDGFACRKEDIFDTLEIIEQVPAGKIPQKKLEPKTCISVMTGSMLPEGTEIVLMVEDVTLIDQKHIKFNGTQIPSTNICYKGEDFKENTKLISKYTQIKPQHAGILATIGITSVPVIEKIKVGIITTGDEVIEPYENNFNGARIRNSNAYQLLTACNLPFVKSIYYGIIKDDLTEITETIKKALEENDVVLISGGVSKGDFDFVPQAMLNNNLKILFKSIAIQPGHPLTFAKNGEKYCFGLPGNPVSVLIQFELTIKPLLYKLTHLNYSPVFFSKKLSHDFERKKANRNSYLPVRFINSDEIEIIPYNGSAHITAYAEADGVILIDAGKYKINKGEILNVRQI